MTIRYDKPIYSRGIPPVSCNPGSERVEEYELIYPETGGVALKFKGWKPLYQQIQANLVNCDLHSVLQSCVHENQLSVCDVNDITGAIADFTGLTEMSEWYAGVKNLENVWRNSPLEVREKFGSSKVRFMSSLTDDDFLSKVTEGYNAYYGNLSKRIDVDKPVISDNEEGGDD